MSLDGACVFCHAPMGDEADTSELLEYLCEHIPIAHSKRGHLNRGPVTEVVVEIDGRSFRARQKNDTIELAPALHLTAWIDLLIAKLSDLAASDPDLRRAILRSGWALR
ncbi:MAG TPA: hypothetical protein VET26_04680 [Candidatus Sulfotelmatobacter sp.]|nr:hypothetical protein [Candidatus Sulfotelmatobacter sp.]